MFEKLLEYDTQLLLFLNNLGVPTWDPFWLIVTDEFTFVPMYAVLLYLLYKKFGLKSLLVFVLVITLMITFTDQITNLFKNGFQRLRPCNNPEIKDAIRVVIHRNSFSFFSGHASNSMGSTMFIFLIIRKFYKHTHLLFFFPLIFAYSRIYLGLHYPLDILTGYVFGIINGIIFYKLYSLFMNKYIYK